jgi:hypothetical protein
MNLKLKWTNLNTGSITVKIYRGTTPVDRANLGTALVTLSAGETEWIDTTVVRGTTYYYVFETITPNDRAVSQNKTVIAGPRRGPGPQSLIAGNAEYGYMGEILAVDFTNTAELRAAVGMSVGTVAVAAPSWHKFMRLGKVLMIPTQPLVNSITWVQLYNLGLIFGTNDNGKGTFLPTPLVNQRKTIKIGPDTFIIRCMTGYSDLVTDVPATSELTAEPNDAFLCEWEDLVYPLFQFTPNKQRLVNVQNYTAAQLGSPSQCIVQERASATQNVLRGSGTAGRQIVSYRQIGLSSTGSKWWPVLELIDSTV